MILINTCIKATKNYTSIKITSMVTIASCSRVLYYSPFSPRTGARQLSSYTLGDSYHCKLLQRALFPKALSFGQPRPRSYKPLFSSPFDYSSSPTISVSWRCLKQQKILYTFNSLQKASQIYRKSQIK